MKAKLNITVDNTILANMKVYAAKNKKSVSELVEEYFLSVTKPKNKKNILQMVEELEAPKFDTSADLKDLFYQEQAKKHGF